MQESLLTANDVRRLAEALDGNRDAPVLVVLREGKLRWLPEGVKPQAGDQELFTVQTDNANPGRKQLEAVRLSPPVNLPGKADETDDVVQAFDALFWTEAAVTKFVLPYYLRFYTPQEVNELWMAFLGLRPDGSRDEESTVLAFGHLPYSEPWVVEPEEGEDPTRDTMVMLTAVPEPVAAAAAPDAAPDAGPPAHAAANGRRRAAGARCVQTVTARQFLQERQGRRR